MKAITLWQPWASLLACGAKQYETRSWATSHRGPIAIHAAQKPFDPLGYAIIAPEFAKATHAALETAGMSIHRLPFGAIIATAELVGCWEIINYVDGGVYVRESITAERKHLRTIGNEGRFGDFTPDRYAWEFANMTMLPEPIPAKGMQRVWNWEG